MSEAIQSPTFASKGQVGTDPYSIPLERIDVSDSELFEANEQARYFERLRREDPVHYCAESDFGPFWSVTKFEDIKSVDTNNEVYSSVPTIVIGDPPADFTLPMFIAMDPPRHDVQRKGVTGAVSPRNLSLLEPTIRQRVGDILESLPVGESFNWVDKVSIELTTQMLATLFDFPFEDRRLLTHWSDCATASPVQTGGTSMTQDEIQAELMKCLEYFNQLWQERKANPGNDFVSMMTQSEAFQDMDPMEYLGNLVLLIVGGNDTTRNSISGGVYALNQHPDEYARLKQDHSLIPNMISEVIRWQTPLMHMRRTALSDATLGGKQIKAGDRVVMWYLSGNRDEDVFEDGERFIIDRPNARQHVSFGYGLHRCMGNRLAEMQLRILWEEILQRFSHVEVVGEPVRARSNFVRGYLDLPVKLHVA
ncbi:MAG: cytochrome P450 [Pseudomonadales bacterium]